MPLSKIDYLKESTMTKLEADFQKYHKDNPHVYELFKRYAQAAIKTGRTSYSAYAIFERIRWHTDIETNDTLDFKLNNNYRPYYARLFGANFPKYRDFFRTRTLNSEKVLRHG